MSYFTLLFRFFRFPAGALLALGLVLYVVAAGAQQRLLRSDFEAGETAASVPDLTTIPVNRWVEFHQPADADWRRSPHAGLAYDSRRGTLLMFGAETHANDGQPNQFNNNYKNDVLEFDPDTANWSRHRPADSPDSYRADGNGRPVAGPAGAPRPWAMHTYDLLTYDPALDALIVGSAPAHQYFKLTQVSGLAARANDRLVTWIYTLGDRRWRQMEAGGVTAPELFAGSMAYDSDRDTFVGYLKQVWELGPDRQQWVQVNPDRNPDFHHTMVYDAGAGRILLFGQNNGGGFSNDVWVYVPGATPGAAGSWQRRTPGGAGVPADEHIPASYDPGERATLLLVDNSGAGRSEGYAYDYAGDRYIALPDAGLPFLQRMNYMMVYDTKRDVHFLVTGAPAGEPAVVWALRLDLDRL